MRVSPLFDLIVVPVDLLRVQFIPTVSRLPHVHVTNGRVQDCVRVHGSLFWRLLHGGLPVLLQYIHVCTVIISVYCIFFSCMESPVLV